MSAVTHLLFVRFASFVRRTSSIWIHDSTLWAFLILDLPVGLQAGAQQIDLMRYMTDASLADMAPELRQKGIDCQTCHKLMRNTEDSRIKIPDGEIAEFVRHAGRSLTLIVMDHDLAEHCKFGKLPHIRVQDAVAEYILRNPAH